MIVLEELSTDRLTARPIKEDDFNLLAPCHADAEIMELAAGGVVDEETTRVYIQDNLQHWRDHGFGLWMWFEKETKSWVGWAGLKYVEIDKLPQVEIAFALCKNFWGKGFATEISKNLISVSFEVLNLSLVVSCTSSDNQRAQSVMKKSGLALVYKKPPHVRYALKKENWQKDAA